MPSANKYIIDVANIKPGGNSIKELWVGNSESKYAMHGNTCIYDKVLYELSVNDISNVEPNAQTVTFTYTSKKTHGNGASDTLGINPTTSAITANHSTASTKTTTCTVKQSLTNNGTLTGNSVNVTVTQIKNYPTGLTLTISPKSTIPAAGGYITTALTNYNYTVTATYKSGSSSAVTSDANTTITANVTGVTAGSKGTTASTATVAGTITFTAKYVCNGKTVTTTANVNIMQDKNEVVAYANPTFTLSPGNTTLPASGGSVTGSVSAIQQVRTWSSTSTDTITPTSTTAWTAQTISCESRGQEDGDTLTLGTTKVTVTANGKSTTKQYTVYQQANGHTDSWNNPVVTITYDTFSAAGETKTPTTCSATQSGTRTWTSGSQTGITNTSFTWGNYSMTNGTGFTLSDASTGAVKAEDRGTITGATRSNNTISRTATGAGSKQGTGSGTVTQEANTFPYETYYGDVNVDSAAVYCGPIPVTGGTVYPSSGGTVIQWRRRTYTSGSYVDDWPDITSVATISYNPTSVYGASNAHSTNTPKRGTVTATWTSPYRSQDGVESASKSVDVYQNADSLVYSKTVYITSFDPTTSTVVNTGGNFTFTFYRANNYYYYWATDGPSGEFLQSYDNTGTTTLTSSNANCTLNKTTNVSNGTSVVLTWTANDGTQRTSTITPGIGSGTHISTQEEAGLRGPYYGLPQLDSVTLSCDDVPAGGGTVYPSWGGTVYQWRYYLNAAGEEVNGEYIVITPSVSWSESSVYASSLGTTEKERTFITTCTASFTGLGGAAPTTKSINVYQQANTKTERTTYSDLRDTSYFRNNYPTWTGETVTFTSAGTVHIGNFYLNSILLVLDAKMKTTTTISYTSGAGSTTTGETGCGGSARCSENWLLDANTSAPIDVGPVVAGDISIKANANPNTTQRTATIHTSFTWQGMTATKDLVVTQEASPVTPTTESYNINVSGGVFSNQSMDLTVWTEYNSTNLSLEGSFACGTLWDECSPALASVTLEVEGEHNFTVSEVPINGTKQITWTVDWSFWKTNGYGGGPTNGSLLNLALYADNSKKQDITISYPTTTRTMDFKYSDLHGASSITLVINAAQQY